MDKIGPRRNSQPKLHLLHGRQTPTPAQPSPPTEFDAAESRAREQIEILGRLVSRGTFSPDAAPAPMINIQVEATGSHRAVRSDAPRSASVPPPRRRASRVAKALAAVGTAAFAVYELVRELSALLGPLTH